MPSSHMVPSSDSLENLFYFHPVPIKRCHTHVQLQCRLSSGLNHGCQKSGNFISGHAAFVNSLNLPWHSMKIVSAFDSVCADFFLSLTTVGQLMLEIE